MDENAELQLPQGLTRVELVEFEGDRLTAVILEGEGVAVPVREYCGALGLDVDAQSARLREHEVLSRGLRVVRVRVGDRMRSVVAILHKYVPFRHLAHRYQRTTGQAIYDRLFAQFRLNMGTPRYDALPAGRYNDALAWLREQAALLLPDDPEALPPQQEALL